MIKNYEALKSKKMGQILCVKKVPIRKSGHICGSAFVLPQKMQ